MCFSIVPLEQVHAEASSKTVTSYTINGSSENEKIFENEIYYNKSNPISVWPLYEGYRIHLCYSDGTSEDKTLAEASQDNEPAVNSTIKNKSDNSYVPDNSYVKAGDYEIYVSILNKEQKLCDFHVSLISSYAGSNSIETGGSISFPAYTPSNSPRKMFVKYNATANSKITFSTTLNNADYYNIDVVGADGMYTNDVVNYQSSTEKLCAEFKKSGTYYVIITQGLNNAGLAYTLSTSKTQKTVSSVSVIGTPKNSSFYSSSIYYVGDGSMASLYDVVDGLSMKIVYSDGSSNSQGLYSASASASCTTILTKNGSAVAKNSCLEAGNYTLSVNYSGNNIKVRDFTVKKIDQNILSIDISGSPKYSSFYNKEIYFMGDSNGLMKVVDGLKININYANKDSMSYNMSNIFFFDNGTPNYSFDIKKNGVSVAKNSRILSGTYSLYITLGGKTAKVRDFKVSALTPTETLQSNGSVVYPDYNGNDGRRTFTKFNVTKPSKANITITPSSTDSDYFGMYIRKGDGGYVNYTSDKVLSCDLEAGTYYVVVDANKGFTISMNSASVDKIDTGAYPTDDTLVYSTGSTTWEQLLSSDTSELKSLWNQIKFKVHYSDGTSKNASITEISDFGIYYNVDVNSRDDISNFKLEGKVKKNIYQCVISREDIKNDPNAVTVNICVADNFPDVSSNEWYYGYVSRISTAGIITGYDNGNFGTTDTLTRGQFATILYRMAGKPAVSGTAKDFSDTDSSAFYAKAVKWASSSNVKVITGYDNGTFGPNDTVTREQMATMMYRYAKWSKVDTSKTANINKFPDGGSVSTFAREGMSWALGEGLITGDQGNINPQGNAQRCVSATIMYRYLKNIKKEII
jgi:hypothetical protein